MAKIICMVDLIVFRRRSTPQQDRFSCDNEALKRAEGNTYFSELNYLNKLSLYVYSQIMFWLSWFISTHLYDICSFLSNRSSFYGIFKNQLCSSWWYSINLRNFKHMHFCKIPINRYRIIKVETVIFFIFKIRKSFKRRKTDMQIWVVEHLSVIFKYLCLA